MRGFESFQWAHLLDILIRLGMAVFLGGIVGWERQSERKPAGLRTHILVSLGAALFVLSGTLTGTDSQGSSRIIQGVVAGIGFLGAGEIFAKSHLPEGNVEIKGLTSAAAIWVSASLGVMAAQGLWLVGLMGAGLAYLVLWGIKKLE